MKNITDIAEKNFNQSVRIGYPQGLDVDQALLQLLQGRQVAIQQRLLVGVLDRNLLDEEVEVDLVATENLEEPG